LIVIALPVAAFHFHSGRIGNGLIAAGAAIIGGVIIAIDLRNGRFDQFDTFNEPQFDDQDDWDDNWDDVDWIDRPTDEPLPGPFQAFWEELQRQGVPGDDEGRHVRKR
jgi:hypothetical protein